MISQWWAGSTLDFRFRSPLLCQSDHIPRDPPQTLTRFLFRRPSPFLRSNPSVLSLNPVGVPKPIMPNSNLIRDAFVSLAACLCLGTLRDLRERPTKVVKSARSSWPDSSEVRTYNAQANALVKLLQGWRAMVSTHLVRRASSLHGAT